jgi:hypothetical protein
VLAHRVIGSKFGRFRSEADSELRLSSGLTAQKPAAMTITPSNTKKPAPWIVSRLPRMVTGDLMMSR